MKRQARGKRCRGAWHEPGLASGVCDERRLDGVALLGGGSLVGALATLHPIWTWPAVMAVAWILRRRVRPGLLMLVLCLIGLQAARAQRHIAEADRAALGWTSEEMEREVEVVSSPVVLRERPGRPRGTRLEAKLVDSEHVVRLYGMPLDARRGDRFLVKARLGPRRRFHQPGGADPRVGLALRPHRASGSAQNYTRLSRGGGLGAWIDAARARVRRRIEATYPEAAVPMARALVLGEQALDPRDAEAFRSSGLSHLLAVSGSHLVIAVVALAQLLRAFLVRIPFLSARLDVGRLVALFTIAAGWLYADFAGGGGSAYRAAAMLSAANVARAWGMRAPAERSFGWSMLTGGAVEPLALLDVSFALSLAATAGLLAARGVVTAIHHRLAAGPARWLVEMAVATLAATAACAPVLLLLGPQLPVMGVAANAIAGPIGEVVALPLSLGHCVASVWPAAERGMAAVAGGALLSVRAIAHAAAGSPWATASLPHPTAPQLAWVTVGVAWVWSVRPRRRAGVLVVLVLSLVAIEGVQSRPPRGELRVTALDVAQGDALLVDLPDGRLMLVDGGGLVGSPIDIAERVLLPELRRRRRHVVDVVVLSHAHPDHYGGLLNLLRRVPVRELWDPSRPKPGSPWHQVRAALKSEEVPILGADALCRAPRRFGAATVTVLAPCPGRDALASENDNSVVLHLRMGHRAALLAGDAEADAEARLLARGAPVRADLLKVGHHGSRTSTSRAFVAAVRPVAAVISRGARNRFGHPHPETKASLAGLVVADTARDGGVMWVTDGRGMSFVRARDAFTAGPFDSPRALLGRSWP